MLPSAALGPHSNAISLSAAPALGRQKHTGDAEKRLGVASVPRRVTVFEITDKWNIANFLNVNYTNKRKLYK